MFLVRKTYILSDYLNYLKDVQRVLEQTADNLLLS